MSVDARVDPIGTVCPTRLALSTTERFPFFRDRALLATEHQVLSLNRVDCAPHITGLLGSTRLELHLLDVPVELLSSHGELLPAFIIGTGESARLGADRRSNQLLTRNSSCFLPCFAPKLYIVRRNKARSERHAGGRVRSAGDGESGKSRRELVDCVRRGPRRGGCIRHRVKPRKHDDLRSARGV